MGVEHEMVNGVHVFRLKGELRGDDARTWEGELTELLKAGSRRFVVNILELTEVDEDGAGALSFACMTPLTFRTKMSFAGDTALRHVNARGADAEAYLYLIRSERQCSIYDNEAEAISEVAAPSDA